MSTATGELATAAPPGLSADLAAAHLRALGHRTERHPDGTLGLASGPLRLECRISWAGPVALPLRSEADVQAACGLMHVHGRRYGRPVPLGIGFASAAAGVLAATGALAALRAARLGAPHSGVEVSVAQAALLGIGQYLAAATADEPAEGEADEEGESDEEGEADEAAAGPGAPPFVSLDGVRFELEALEAEGWRRFWAALGADRRVVARAWRPFQLRYATALCPLPAALAAATATLPYRQLAELAAECGVTATEVAARATPGAGSAVPWRITPGGRAAVPGRPPGRGRGPLDGVTVVEVARRVQGPLAGHVLGLLGARVVRVEPPGGDPLRGVPPMAGPVSARFAALNRHKEVLEADLRSPAGRAAVRGAVAGADVLLHSLAPAKVPALGLDADSLTAVRPGLVHVQASGSGPERGPGPPLGTDYPVQAYSGLAALVTPPGEQVRPSLMTLCDVLGGLVCAEGAVAALEARERTGLAQRVESSLLSAARLLCRLGGGSGPAPSVPVCSDLAALAADPRLAPVLDRAGCALVRPPWTFRP
ncbi:CoA transferase [Kitasatospora sp. DSM 101779]|uniref:CoA transferase n=1 Tax=Kitasatospora sp. DSM 101779 TaxID=2853165 RepID=UPI0021D951DB|nr:CoA transferase [Kitasatospora sp. DSM 101779]MCU7826545.1 CoA transferase [Kitasatospora sp. DSM 101779]